MRHRLLLSAIIADDSFSSYCREYVVHVGLNLMPVTSVQSHALSFGQPPSRCVKYTTYVTYKAVLGLETQTCRDNEKDFPP